MPDLLVLGLIAGWFLLLLAYLWACGRLAR
jgi:hypothetical protein